MMENEESEERAEREDLSPAEALAGTQAAREALVRRVKVPWAWDAFAAAATGLLTWLFLQPPFTWLVLVPFAWLIVISWMSQARLNRRGVAFDGLRRRATRREKWWYFGVIQAVWATAVALDLVWGHGHVFAVATGISAVLFFTFRRSFNRSVIAAIRDAP